MCAGPRARLARPRPRARGRRHALRPRGYSLNALREGPDDSYYTLHVTPGGGRATSASRPTPTCAPGAIPELVQKVVGCSSPESFDVVSFIPGGARAP
ncbi:MAG: hypothetical protein R3F62_29470 [Planctomycetota bacterium]